MARKAEDSITELDAKLMDLPNIDAARKIFGVAKKHFERHQELTAKENDLATIEVGIGYADLKIKRIQQQLVIEEKVTETGILIEKYATSAITIDSLANLERDITNQTNTVHRTNTILESTRDKIPKLDKMLNELENKIAKGRAIKKIVQEMSAAHLAIVATQGSINDINSTISDIQKKLDEHIATMEICPFSGGELYESCRELLGKVE